MLRRGLLAGLLVVFSGLLMPSAAAEENCQLITDYFGNVKRVCTGGGSSGGGGGDAPDPGRSGEKATKCYYGSTEVACVTGAGTWSSIVKAWCRPTSPQPPFTDAVWSGKTTGKVYTCSPPTSDPNAPDFGLQFQRWLASSPELPPPDPEVLAWRALAQVNLQPIDLGIAPEPLATNANSLGAVGLPVWLWSDTSAPNKTGPISDSASERGFTVTITARLKNITWNLGDGSAPIQCGIGTRFNPATMGPQTPVTCGRQAGYSKQGEYTITATSNWEVSWQGIGQSGMIPYTRETSGTVRIGEIQVVVTDN